MNKELLTIALAFGCIAANANTNNYDLLGRKGSKMNSPMVYKNVDYSKAKKNEQQKLNSSLENRGLAKQAVGLKDGVDAIIGVYGYDGSYKFLKRSSALDYVGLSGSMTLSNYLSKANDAFIPVVSDNRPINNNDYIYDWIDGATLTGYSGYTMEEYPYDMPQNEFLSYASYRTIDSLLNRNYRANSNVGVYMAEKGLPVRLNPVTDPNPSPFIIADYNAVIQSFSTTVGHEMDASRMYKLLHRFSDRSVVYSTKTRPSNPAEHRLGPQIYMGVHGYGGSAMTRYNATAKNLDNYIYDNRTVEIVSAGDKANKLSAEGFAVNAITVGAIDSKTGNVASYSGHNAPLINTIYGDTIRLKNGEILYSKPEIYNYTKFYIDDFFRSYSYPSSSRLPYEYKPFYDSTRTAAGVTASMVSNMLSKNEFYRWHPEVVKAVMLNAQATKNFNYNELGNNLSNHSSLYFIGKVDALMKVFNDKMSEQTGSYGKKEIRIKINGESLGGGGRGLSAAIAWLNSGNDVANLQKLPQNYQLNIITHNTSGTVKYRLDATTAEYDSQLLSHKSLTIPSPYWFQNEAVWLQIVLEEEDTRSENYGQMVLGVDIMPYNKR